MASFGEFVSEQVEVIELHLEAMAVQVRAQAAAELASLLGDERDQLRIGLSYRAHLSPAERGFEHAREHVRDLREVAPRRARPFGERGPFRVDPGLRLVAGVVAEEDLAEHR